MKKKSKILIILVILCLSKQLDNLKLSSATDVYGNIIANTTWTAAGSPYVLQNVVAVVSGVTLTIEPGVVVMPSETGNFAGGYGFMDIYGELIAIGAPNNPITFQFENNDPIDSRPLLNFATCTDAIVDENYDWVSGTILKYCNFSNANAIRIYDSSPYISENTVEYGGLVTGGAIYLDGSESVIKNNTISNNRRVGIYISSSAGNLPKIINNTITYNGGGGIRIDGEGGAGGIISGNTIVSNYAYWWGGGIAVSQGTWLIEKNLIANNTCGDAGTVKGAAIGAEAANLTIVNNTIYRNHGITAMHFDNGMQDLNINYNNIINNNGTYDLIIGGVECDATNNYWGETDYDTIMNRIENTSDVNINPIALIPFENTDIDTPSASDIDEDGLTDYEEAYSYGTSAYSNDTDIDGLNDWEEIFTYGTNPANPDTDNDGLNDWDELMTYGTDVFHPDSDLDGMPDGWEVDYSFNPLLDTDNLTDADTDGLLNVYEFQNGTHPHDSDTDDDNLIDGDEVTIHGTDPLNNDTDSDGLLDGDEFNIHSTNPLINDTDSDGLTDGDEINTHSTNPLNPDTDNDQMFDGWEIKYAFNPLDENDNMTDFDEDNLENVYEFTNNTNPLNNDTDIDGLMDGEEVKMYNTDPLDSDSDDDNLIDGVEINTYSTDPNDPDSDDDGLTDDIEVGIYDTDPTDNDTDDDYIPDKWEVDHSLNPLNPLDYSVDIEADGLTNLQEYFYNTDPHKFDTDGDGFSDKSEIDSGTDPLDSLSVPTSAPPLTPPDGPQNLSATPGENFIELSWDPPNENGGSEITSYRVYRGTASGNYIYLGLTMNTNYMDYSVISGITYYYVITAMNAVGESIFSQEVSGTTSGIAEPTKTIPDAPQDLSATVGDNYVYLSWNAPSDGGSVITRYNVYRGTATGEYVFLGTTTSTSFNDTLAFGGIRFYYVVTAINAVGESAFSDEVSATPTGTVSVPRSGTFPSFALILLFLGTLVVVMRKFQKKREKE